MTPWVICGILAVIVLVLSLKIIGMHSSMKEITSLYEECLNDDTNMLVTVSSGDRHIRMLVKELNACLRQLRKQRIQYENGDMELKEAVTNISHDLRTPLTAISGYLELLEEEEKSEAVEKYLAFIKDRTEKMKELTEELFRYTIILSAEELELSFVDANSVLEKSLLSFYGAMKERGIEPEITCPEEKTLIWGNEQGLERVLGNVISNVLKYSDGDFQITLSKDGEIVLANHAKALDEVSVEKLFHRFYTVESAHHSTGLGLAIAKELVKQMGGEIYATYEEEILAIHIKMSKG